MTAASPGPAPADVSRVRDDYVEALLAPDSRAAWQIIDDALSAGTPARHIYLDVLAPAMVEIGRCWEAARISVAQEHLATQITQTVLARLAPELADGAATASAGLALVSGTPGELHAVGARMVADFLEGAGWDVLLVGVDAPGDDVVALAAARRPDVVALSTTLPANVLAAGRLFGALGRLDPRPLLVAGGAAYRGDPSRALATGADVFAADPGVLIAELAARVA